MKTFLFSLKSLPILNPMKEIEACDAGILSNKKKDNHVNPLNPLPCEISGIVFFSLTGSK